MKWIVLGVPVLQDIEKQGQERENIKQVYLLTHPDQNVNIVFVSDYGLGGYITTLYVKR